MDSSNSVLKWELLVADSWDDLELRQRLLSDPMSVCKERGIIPPEGVKLHVVEDTEHLIHLVLPMAPDPSELSEEALESAAGGVGFGGCAGGVCGSPCIQTRGPRPRLPRGNFRCGGFGGCAGGICGSPCVQNRGPSPQRLCNGGGFGGFN